MKKIWDLILCLCLLFSAPAGAERTVVTALATEVNPDALFSVAVDARIREYNPASETLTVELIIPELFAAEDVEGLKAGDAIYTQGREVEIKTVSESSGYLVLNEGDFEFSEGSVWLYQGIDMNYWIAEYDDHTWNVLCTVRVPVPEHLLFLDGIVPFSGEMLLYPTVHSGREFLEMLEEEKTEGPGFAANNVTVFFDENGELALIRRYYVPWQ